MFKVTYRHLFIVHLIGACVHVLAADWLCEPKADTGFCAKTLIS